MGQNAMQERPSMPARFAAACEQVADRGWRRVILLGEDWVQGPFTLKACLAQAGVLVLSPGPADRAWLALLAEEARAGYKVDDGSLERLTTLLGDGLEHGVDGLVTTDPVFASLVGQALGNVELVVLEGERA